MEIYKTMNDSETDHPHFIATDLSADSKRPFKQLQVPISKNCPINNMYKNIRFKYLCSKFDLFDFDLDFNSSFDGVIKGGKVVV